MTKCRLLSVAMLLLLAACSRSGSSNQAVHAPDYLVRGNGAEIKSLDPHYIDGTWEANVVGDALIGLTTDAADGSPIPGAALSWETSADGTTWIFHLREHIWSDGQPVTAEDFVFAWRRILEPARGAPYAYYLWLIKNGKAVSEGKLPPSALGVIAKDDKTLVVELEHPAPYMLQYLLHQSVFPVPRHVVTAKGNAWAIEEISSIGSEFGEALSAFVWAFRDYDAMSAIVLVSMGTLAFSYWIGTLISYWMFGGSSIVSGQTRGVRQFHVSGQQVPAVAASPATLEGGTLNTSVNVDFLVIANSDTSSHTITVVDCASTPFLLFTAAPVAAQTTWTIPLGNMRFTSCFQWSASSTTVYGSVVGTR